MVYCVLWNKLINVWLVDDLRSRPGLPLGLLMSWWVFLFLLILKRVGIVYFVPIFDTKWTHINPITPTLPYIKSIHMDYGHRCLLHIKWLWPYLNGLIDQNYSVKYCSTLFMQAKLVGLCIFTNQFIRSTWNIHKIFNWSRVYNPCSNYYQLTNRNRFTSMGVTVFSMGKTWLSYTVLLKTRFCLLQTYLILCTSPHFNNYG